MKITPDHWLDTATRDPIPGGLPMGKRRFLVIHFTGGAGAKSSIQALRERKLSAHFVIDRDGTIFQCRPCDTTCGHAGASRWTCPRSGLTFYGLNTCTIGIELANAGDNPAVASKWSDMPRLKLRHKNGGPLAEWEQYPKDQLAACEALSKLLVTRYNLDDLVGHDDIAPDRKNDPGPAFPMEKLRRACGFTTPITSNVK